MEPQKWTLAAASVISFIVGTASPEVLNWLKHKDDRQDHRDLLSDGERDYVLQVIELQSKADPKEAQAIAALTNVATTSYLRSTDFKTRFASAVSSYALAVSGAKASVNAEASDKKDASSIGAAGALGWTQAAANIAQSSGQDASSAPQPIQAALAASKARVFFQVAQQADQPTASAVNSQLVSAFGASLTPIAGVELVPGFSGQTQLRYFYRADKATAQQIANALAGALPGIVCRYIGGYDINGKAKPQLFEVWLRPGTVPQGNVRLSAANISC